MDKTSLTNRLKDRARELGFSLAGITSPDPPAHMDVYTRWLEHGRHGEMGYLAAQRAVERRADPRSILPECKSILILGVPYDKASHPPETRRGTGRVAAYARGDDYHNALKPRLKALVHYLEELTGRRIPNRWYTDSGPILERELAQRAGLGWIGKNTMLINPERGSYFLLAEILLGIELDFDAPITSDHCGTCRRCIEACPTGCIREDRTLDAARCISYLTIELKGPVPADLRTQMGDWVFGCDICQMVCPWNERFAAAEGDPKLSGKFLNAVLGEELQIGVQDFNQRFKTSPVKRAKRRGYLRNAAIAAGNTGDKDAVPPLINLLTAEEEPLIRSHAAWALGEIGGQHAIEALKSAANGEGDPAVLEEIRNALSR